MQFRSGCQVCCCCLIRFCAHQQVQAEVAAQATQEADAAHQAAQEEAASLQTALCLLQSEVQTEVERAGVQPGLVEQLQAEVALLQQQLELSQQVSLRLYTHGGAKTGMQISTRFFSLPIACLAASSILYDCENASQKWCCCALLPHATCCVKCAHMQTSLPTASTRCPLHTVAPAALLLTMMKPVMHVSAAHMLHTWHAGACCRLQFQGSWQHCQSCSPAHWALPSQST